MRMSSIVGKWMKGKGLQLALEKTEAVLLSGRRKSNVNFLIVENVQIRPKKVVRSLANNSKFRENDGSAWKSNSKRERGIVLKKESSGRSTEFNDHVIGTYLWH